MGGCHTVEPFGSLDENGPLRLVGGGCIGGVALLEDVCHRVGFEVKKLKPGPVPLSLPAAPCQPVATMLPAMTVKDWASNL